MAVKVRLADLRSQAYFAALETERPSSPGFSHQEAACRAAAQVGVDDVEQLARAWVHVWLENAAITRRWYGVAEDLPGLDDASARAVVARARQLWETLAQEHDRARSALGLESVPPPLLTVEPPRDEDQPWVARWLAG